MRKQKVRFELDTGDIKKLGDSEIKAILRAADALIFAGGRNLLGKVLKGSRDKKVIEYALDQCPAYGFYQTFTLEEIGHRIDWMIRQGYLQIEYQGRLPLLVFSEKGWAIEKETYAEELLQILENQLDSNHFEFVANLKDMNRDIILLLIEKIRRRDDQRFIVLLEAWKEIEYRKVQAELQKAINYLGNR